MPEQQRVFEFRRRELHILYVHLLDLERAVRIDFERGHARREADLLGRLPGEYDLVPADVKAADLPHQNIGASRYGDDGRGENGKKTKVSMR